MARSRKPSGSAELAEVGRSLLSLPSRVADVVIREDPAVIAELTRMASVGAGGTCVLYRCPPEVAPEVYAEIRRLFLAAGARAVTGLPAYSLDREAAAVIEEIVKGLGA